MGTATATASIGAVTTQVIVETLVCSPAATLGRATTKTVKSTLLDNNPASTTASTHHL
jgi:hypothetical protein